MSNSAMKPTEPPVSIKCAKPTKCNKVRPGMFNFHFVPHTHSDLGWKKTMDKYYTGLRGGKGKCAKCVLDKVIPELLADPSRRFMYVELAYLSQWFQSQNSTIKKAVKTLVDEGRLDLVGGGWSMADTATTSYDDIIDQHTLGMQWIESELGECNTPNVAWHVDQFGHSREYASLMAQMGFDGLIVGRLDHKDHRIRSEQKTLEMIWQGSPDNLGERSSLFTSILFDGYFTPAGLGWEGRPPTKREDQQKLQAKAIMSKGLKWADSYRTSHILIPIGGDFSFGTAKFWYNGLDNLIKSINAELKFGSVVHSLYSTPSCYIESVQKEAVEFESKTDDFLPYSIKPDTYWTGYYTSRPGLKYHVRVASSLLQTCRELAVMARLTGVKDSIDKLKKSVAVLQHHQAITGTSTQEVTNDYNRMLSEGESSCQNVINLAYRRLLRDSTSSFLPAQMFCTQINVSSCDITERAERLAVTLFNPLGHRLTYWVHIPVAERHYSIIGPSGKYVVTQYLPLSHTTLQIPERATSHAKMDLVFQAILPPLGFAIYMMQATRIVPPELPLDESDSGRFTLSNQYLTLTVDSTSGMIRSLRNKVNNLEINLDQRFLYYMSNAGQKRNRADRNGGFYGTQQRSSGAYVFSPKRFTNAVEVKGHMKIRTYKGPNVQEIRQEFDTWISQVIRLYDDTPYIELEWTVGPIPDIANESKEVISRFSTDLDTQGMFYTDANGRENIKRVRDSRSYWQTSDTKPPPSANYYPVTSRMFIRDVKRNCQLTIVTDRSQGGGSLADGQMELMIHRRTFTDDDIGLDEPLNEKGTDGRGLIIRGKHYLFLDTILASAKYYRTMGLQVRRPPTMSFMVPLGNIFGKLPKWVYGLRASLPPHVHLLTLDQLHGEHEQLLLRLENFYEASELDYDAQESIVVLQYMFSVFDIIDVNEVSLATNHDTSRIKRKQWKTTDGSLTPTEIGSEDAVDMLKPPFPIRLRPMEIRTFKITPGPPSTSGYK